MTITAEVVAHSAHPGCPDLISMKLRYPRFIHAEAKTHRLIRIDDAEVEFLQEISLMDDPKLSRCASSSRAVPIDRMIQEILDDPAMPVTWGSNKPGMQAGAEIDRPDLAMEVWLDARDRAVDAARDAQRLGLHKQIVNRLIEPFAHISVIVTATEWDNFFSLRRHEAADPTMRALADAMYQAKVNSKPAALPLSGVWHRPFATGPDDPATPRQIAARCARVSYLNHDGKPTTAEADEKLADTLESEAHMSPFEHVARPTPGQRHHNLNGWQSLRALMEDAYV
ncbi:hypothetical protein UFOVP233_84 [uncultured Caudovirales phage]|uniref:Uncharacterized protein n=1 Tax=uncultured Caudovirales phage TaxID=2100421 RepID=A0A6J7WWF5_9CAUD|nr:hypothetical protein UFOVP233_84 [uncultured Caudovirales phage]